MIKIPYEEILLKINEKTQMSNEEIGERVTAKMKQLSGLISKEGAAHIIANELGVKIFEPLSGKLQIKNVLVGMRDVETVGKVLEVSEVRQFTGKIKSGQVASMVIGDDTGTIRVVMWGDQANNAANISQGAIVKVAGGYVRDNRDNKEIHLNDKSQLMINPEGETVKNVVEHKQSDVRKSIKDLSENDNNVEVLGTVVQVFDLRFYEICSQCGKRARPNEGVYSCATHGSVTPDYGYVLNAVVDDGTETIRCVFFRNQLDRLLNMSKEQVLKFKDTPSEFDTAKHELLGTLVKLNGRANNNQMFNRLEFVAQRVDINPNPEEEMKRLKSD